MSGESQQATAVGGNGAAETITTTATESTNALIHSFREALDQVGAFAPKVLAALVVLVIGFVISRLVAKAVTALCDRLGLQRAVESGGLMQSMRQVGIERTVPQIIGLIVFWLLMCVFLVASFDILDLPAVTVALQKVLAYIPRVLVATIVVVLGLLLASFLRGLIAASADRAGISYAPQLAAACYWIMALMTFIAAFDQLEIEFRLLNEAILIALAAVGLALGLSFGLGGRDVMAGILAGYYIRQRWQAGDHVRVAGIEGLVREVGPVSTIVETEEKGMMQRRSIPNVVMLNEAIR